MKKTNTVAIMLALACSVLVALAQLFFKIGSKDISGVASFFGFYVMFGLMIYAIASLLYLLALKKGQVSVVALVLALNYVWVALFSFFMLKESMDFARLVGISSITIGAIIIGVSGLYDI